MTDMLQIDGARGEGGGQIIRSALALSIVTGRPIEIRHIRAGRKTPGLLRQHLTALAAAREICGGDVSGDQLHSDRLTFVPGPVQTRGFQFDVGTAGSAILVAQTVLPALLTAEGNCSLEIRGGTHNMAAPTFDYLHEVYLPLLSRMGPRFDSRIDAWGFYPAGGGQVQIDIHPAQTLSGLRLTETGGMARPTVTALVADLPKHIGERECQLIRHRAGWKPNDCMVRTIEQSDGPGNVVMIRLTSPNVTEMFTGFGRRGVRAEQVATTAWNQARQYLADGVPVGEHLCDQLLLPLGLAAQGGETSSLVTGPLSGHSETHMEILKMFLDIEFQITPLGPRQNRVDVTPAGSPPADLRHSENDVQNRADEAP